MFVDVAGFSTISERLAAEGTQGTERLTEELNAFFDPSIDLIHDCGGDVLAFGGDSMFVAFNGSTELADLQHCADGIHAIASSHRSSSSEDIAIAVRIGVDVGEVVSTVAKAGARTVVLHGGDGIDRAVNAHRSVDPGATGWGSEPLIRPHHRHTLPSRPIPLTRRADLVHPVIARRIGNASGFVAEHRRVTCAFVAIENAEWSTEMGVDRIAAVVDAALAVVTDLGGELVQFTSGDKGSVILALFGAPLAIADPGAAAIGAAHRLREEFGASIRVGIASGPSFMLLLGGSRRRAYTVIGDTPNLAARLMTISEPDTTTCDGDTVAIAGSRCSVRSTTTIRVKGRVTNVDASVVEPTPSAARCALDRIAADTPLVGRADERLRLAALVDGVASGRGGVVVVRGESGLGKSRLLREMTATAPTSVTIALATGDRLTSARSYSSWRSALLTVLGDPANRLAAADAVTDLLPRAAALTPLVLGVLGFESPETALTDHLGPAERAELTTQLVADLVIARASRAPLLVVVEDAHWLDDATADLLWALSREGTASGLGLAVFTRPELTLPRSIAPSAILDLEPLDDREADQLIADAWTRSSNAEPPSNLHDLVRASAAGNPLFVESLVDAIRDRPDDPSLTLPGDLTNLLATRLDRLPENARRTVRLAAVYGTAFNAADLAGCFGVSLRAVGDDIDRLLGDGLVQTEVRQGNARFAFRHATVRDVAYQQISHHDRRSLHGRAARYLIELGEPPLVAATHALRSRDRAIELEVLPAAGSAATKAWDLKLATSIYERLVEIEDGADREDAGLELARLDLIAGRSDRFTALLEPRSHEPARRAGQDLVLAEHAFNSGRLTESYDHARSALDAVDPHHESAQAAREMLVRVLGEQGNHQAAIELASDMLDRAVEAGDPHAEVAALASLGVARALSGQAGEARDVYEKARSRAVELGDALRYVHVTSDLHFVAAGEGDLERARELLLAAREAAEELGYRRHLAISVGNQANLALMANDRSGAAPVAIDAIGRLLDLGDAPSAMNSVDTAFRAIGTAGEPTRMAALSAHAARIEGSLGREQARCETLILAAAWAVLADDPAAEALSTEVRELALALDVAELVDDAAGLGDPTQSHELLGGPPDGFDAGSVRDITDQLGVLLERVDDLIASP